MAELHTNIRELIAEMEEDRTKLPEQLMMYSRELGEVVVVTEEEKGQMAGKINRFFPISLSYI